MMCFLITSQASFDIEYEYMYGDDLLVAPVTEPEVLEWTVYLPGQDEAIFEFNYFEFMFCFELKTF